MFKQYYTIKRPDTSAEFFPMSTEYKNKQEAIEELRSARPDLVTNYERTISEDQLTYQAILTFPTVTAYKEYQKYLDAYNLTKFPGISQYYVSNNHTLMIEGEVDGGSRETIFKINC